MQIFGYTNIWLYQYFSSTGQVSGAPLSNIELRNVIVPLRSLNFGFRNCDVNTCEYVLASMQPVGDMNYIPHGFRIQWCFATRRAMQIFGYAHIWLYKYFSSMGQVSGAHCRARSKNPSFESSCLWNYTSGDPKHESGISNCPQGLGTKAIT